MHTDCRTRMGKVFFEDPIHHISGKISKKYRTCYNHKRVNGLNFTSVHGERTTPVSAEEKARQERFKMVATVATAIVTCVAIALGLSSCNVTRTITTRSEAWQKGDTSVIIQTKTVETYDASKKGL